jgi:hypothetical protein
VSANAALAKGILVAQSAKVTDANDDAAAGWHFFGDPHPMAINAGQQGQTQAPRDPLAWRLHFMRESCCAITDVGWRNLIEERLRNIIAAHELDHRARTDGAGVLMWLVRTSRMTRAKVEI